ncbi:MAG: putative PepSY TM-like [Verrucomicrobiota bacterium]|jgi:hypothetical protein
MRIHLYGGLVCFWYLLVFGISSLSFNHPGWIPSALGQASHWEHSVALPDLSSEDLKLAEAIQRELDLIGWVLPWTLDRRPSGDLRFELHRPGRQYVITTDRSSGRVQVEERTAGAASILNFLHGSNGGVPGSRFLHLWGLYTEITTGLVLLLAVSGVVLWARRTRNRGTALLILGVSSVASLALMAWMCFVG